MALGALVAVGLLEAALWIGYAALRPVPEFEMGAHGEGSRTILCIGDSNTYGVHLPREESYPGRLQSFLDRWPENPWRVVNVGYPGHNSAEIRGRLAGHLREYQPEIVICWVGVNNGWSYAGRHLWETPDREPEPSLLERAVQHVRVVKLGRIATNYVTSRFRQGDAGVVVPTAQRIRATMYMDFVRIRDICAAHGAKLLMADYPVHIEFTENRINSALRDISARAGIPMVRLHQEVLPVAYRVGYYRAMLRGHHANGVGNHEVARRVLLALIENGMLEERPEWTSVPPVHEILDESPILIVDHDSERAQVVLRGPPGARFRIDLARLYAGDADRTRNAGLPYAPYRDWSEEELVRRGLRGELDAEGRGRSEVLLPPEPEEHPRPTGRRAIWLGWRLRVQYESTPGVPLEAPSDPVDALLDPTVLP